MVQFYQKKPLAFSLIWIAAYVVLLSAADNASAVLGVAKSVTAPAALLLAGLLLFFLKANGLGEEYGLCPLKGQARDFLYFLPLAGIASCNLWNGAALTVSPGEAVLFVVSMLCVGFLEEVIFRGLLFRAMCRGGSVKSAVTVSSITFGLGHVVNLLNGAELPGTLLQIAYAAALGYLFVTIFRRGGSLLPCILAHGVINSLSLVGVEGSRASKLATAAILCAVSLGYALWIEKRTACRDAPAKGESRHNGS